jgi:Cu2+-exporting ATPase
MFYDLKAETPLTPLRERPFQDRDWEWLENLLESDADEVQTIVLGIQGLSCVACVWLVEAVAKKINGVYSVSLSITRGSIEVVYQSGEIDAAEFANSLYKLGYEISRSPANSNEAGGGSSLAIKLGICGALAMNTMGFTLPRYTGMEASDELHELLTIVIIASSTLTFFIGGSYFFKRAWSALRLGHIHMDLPISIGLILAFLGSIVGWLFAREELFYFDFVAIFTFLMLLGKQVQQSSLSRANAKFGSDSTIPERYENPAGEQLQTHEISAGEQLVIPAGTVIPTASRLMSEVAECSLAWITGEPATLVYEKSDPLPAGAVNQSQDSITVETVDAVDTDHFFHQLPKQNDALSPALAKFIRYYLVAILFIGVIAGGAWLMLSDDWVKAIQVMISIYVVSCPCGIGLALPLLDTRFNKLANNIGVFPLTATCWAGFLKLKRVVFDKTGTLTLDRPALENKST